MSLIEEVRIGRIPEIIHKAAQQEGLDPKLLAEGIKEGSIVIPANNTRQIEKPFAVGKGTRVKINANIGTSQDHDSIEEELEKLKIAVQYGADAVMDLSTGSRTQETRLAVLEHSPVPIGTVPVYEAFLKGGKAAGSISGVSADTILASVEQHGKDGVDFVTLHCGLTLEAFRQMKEQTRMMNIVSRGGALLVQWMIGNNAENPLYEQYDRVLEICKAYDMTISLGDGLRPGCLADASDRAQIQELLNLGELAARAHKAGVQVIIEGPGHVPLDQVETNIRIQKTLCNNAPFYVLGPLVTDIAPGYDHISGAIGGAVAAMAGADFLCYVTPAEHLRLPNVDDVREGVIASRIAAHAADIARGFPGARNADDRMAKARCEVNWEGMFKESMDPEKARRMHDEMPAKTDDVCSMCGEFCAVKTINEIMKK